MHSNITVDITTLDIVYVLKKKKLQVDSSLEIVLDTLDSSAKNPTLTNENFAPPCSSIGTSSLSPRPRASSP